MRYVLINKYTSDEITKISEGEFIPKQWDYCNLDPVKFVDIVYNVAQDKILISTNEDSFEDHERLTILLKANFDSKVAEFKNQSDTRQYVELPTVSIEEQVKQLTTNANDYYMSLNISTVDIEALREAKVNQLDKNCTDAINGRFTSIVNGVQYEFSYDSEAQSNFTKAGRAFDKALITSIPWTAYQNGEVVRITLDEAAFDQVFADSLMHLNTKINQFRDTLEPKVKAATTKEQIDAIAW